MLGDFERQAKRKFKESSQRSYIKFGSMGDDDPAVGIRRGKLTLEGYVMSSVFLIVQTEVCYLAMTSASSSNLASTGLCGPS